MGIICLRKVIIVTSHNQAYYRLGYADGYANSVPRDAHIEYIYHEHTGNSDKNPIPDGDVYYSLSDPGGCYKADGHTHNQAGASCNQYRYDDVKIIFDADGATVTCNYCGCTWHAQGYKYGDDTAAIQYCAKKYGDDMGIGGFTHWSCKNQPANTWKVNCGEYTTTMVGATIIWE